MVARGNFEIPTFRILAECSSSELPRHFLANMARYLLSLQDSNLNSLAQNQMCCHYTKGQYSGANGIRTHILFLAREALSQLSYDPINFVEKLSALNNGLTDTVQHSVLSLRSHTHMNNKVFLLLVILEHLYV